MRDKEYNIENQFPSRELVKKLREELGFSEPTIAFFNGQHIQFKISDKDGTTYHDIDPKMDIGQCYSAPLWQECWDFIFERYGLDGFVIPSTKETFYDWEIYDEEGNKKFHSDEYFNSRLLASGALLVKLIEVAKIEVEEKYTGRECSNCALWMGSSCDADVLDKCVTATSDMSHGDYWVSMVDDEE